MPLPSVIFAMRPLTRTLRSASRIAGSPATGRSVAAVPSISIDSASSGSGGPLGCNCAHVALTAMSMRWTFPLTTCTATQSRTFGARKDGHSRFITAAGIGLQATPSARRGSPP